MNNETMQFLPAELSFSMGRLAAIGSLLFLVIVVLIVLFLLFFQQRSISRFNEHEFRSDTEVAFTESRTLELSHLKQYSSTDVNRLTTMSTSINSLQLPMDEELTGSRIELISSK